MSYPQKTTITITTAADGTATAYSDKRFSGFVKAIVVVGGTLTANFDVTITTEETLQTVLIDTTMNDAEVYYPRPLFCSTAAGTAGTGDDVDVFGVPVVNERIKCVVANGGNAMTGSLVVIYA